MKTQFAGLAVVALLSVGPPLPGHAEETTAAPTTTQTPAAPPTEAPPPSVPRPSLAPKAAEPASPAAAAEFATRHHRRYAQHHWRRYAYWEPFPVYWPHVYHNRLRWNRIPWFTF
jgi:hypothetical protein